MEPHQLIDTNSHLHTAEDYRKAIASLDSSTLAIESQISIIRRILETINTSNSNLTSKHHKLRSTTHTKHQTLSTQISSQHSTLATHLTAMSANLKKVVSSTLVTVDDTLSRDDYVFGQIAMGLEGVNTGGVGGEEGDDLDDDDDTIQTRTQRLLDALIRTESEVIRTRLERVYLEVLNSTITSDTNDGYDTHDDEEELDVDARRYIDPTKIEILKSDLRTLYAEINNVTALFVAHEHGDTLSQLDADVARVREILRARQCGWAVERLREMTGRLRIIEDGLRGVQGQRIVVRRLSGYLEELSVQSGMAGRDGRINTGGVRKEVDGPALVGLRGYLGVGSGGGSRGDRIDEVFRGVKRGVEEVLDVHSEQAEMLKRDGRQGDEGVARGYGIMLDELDEEIARIKESIETLPG